jgi:hypothetical protein
MKKKINLFRIFIRTLFPFRNHFDRFIIHQADACPVLYRRNPLVQRGMGVGGF